MADALIFLIGYIAGGAVAVLLCINVFVEMREKEEKKEKRD